MQERGGCKNNRTPLLVDAQQPAARTRGGQTVFSHEFASQTNRRLSGLTAVRAVANVELMSLTCAIRRTAFHRDASLDILKSAEMEELRQIVNAAFVAA